MDVRRGDDAVIQELYDEGELSELLQSIASNGYLDFEPLVVTLIGPTDMQLTVLEGNRRLAAIRVLNDRALAARLSIATPDILPSVASTLRTVRVIRVTDRVDARPFIAFKHINGPHRWESFAKAKFAAAWYNAEKNRGAAGLTLSGIAERIGDNHDTIKRMIAAIYVLDQAAENNIFSIEDRTAKKFSFSHLYTALARSEYMKYLGLDESWTRFDPEPNPVPTKSLKELKEVLYWIFGSKKDDKLPVVRSQNPDIKNLGIVLAHPGAVHLLREKGDLGQALAQATPPEQMLSSALVQSLVNLQEAVKNLRAFDGTDRSLFDIVKDIVELAQTLKSRMEEKIEKIEKTKQPNE
ncbi:MAG: hypothetical protein JRN20_19275 [Nitrososphaerota archaeon]|nr:hypothetical protein [Nitrososphaerota archaeon]